MKILIHVTVGPDDRTKSALSFLVAKTALSEGHSVDLFLAGESVRLLDKAILADLEGKEQADYRSISTQLWNLAGNFIYLVCLRRRADMTILY